VSDEVYGTDTISVTVKDGYAASMVSTDDKVRHPSGGVMGHSDGQDLDSSDDKVTDDQDRDGRVVSPVNIASPTKGEDERGQFGGAVDVSDVGDVTLVTSLN
jgi:hypothetical protein